LPAPKFMSFNGAEIERAAEVIRGGGLVAFPTETVYGLGANALDAGAACRIYEAKGRPAASPLIVHVDSAEMARGLARRWPDEAEALAERYWPGPLTLVVPKDPRIPDVVTAGLETVGLRVPAHPLALALIRKSGVPIAAPSANRFSELSPTTAEHVRRGLGAAVDLILDGGPTTVGIESTVLSLAETPARLLRPGMISREEIEEAIGPVTAGWTAPGASAHPAPGLHARHYSPRTPLMIVRGGALPGWGRGAYMHRGERCPEGARDVPMPPGPAAYAAVLYETLHALDREGLDWIAVERLPEAPEWAAVADRLSRAATG
jgi:L-threonylcarbamoyladenylate synthase